MTNLAGAQVGAGLEVGEGVLLLLLDLLLELFELFELPEPLPEPLLEPLPEPLPEPLLELLDLLDFILRPLYRSRTLLPLGKLPSSL